MSKQAAHEPDSPQHHPPSSLAASQERLDHQRIGEALLTDDGRVTDTGQAKTIAVQALAKRLRSSTPELVLAAFGLIVGTDMAHRIGDGRYVLVPHHDRYPWMGADVLHVDELDPANPAHAAGRVVRMDAPLAEPLVRWIAVSELLGSWAYGSNNNVRVLALQEAAREEFGLTKISEWRTDPDTRAAVSRELRYNRDALRDFLRTQYEMTQEVLARRGITEVISYRTLTWQEGAPQPTWASLDVGDTIAARHRPLASWATDLRVVVDRLEQRGGRAVILVHRKPARDVLSLPTTGMGYLPQRELVTLPGDGLATLDGVFTGTAPAALVEQTAASSVALGAPVLDDAPRIPGDEPVDRPSLALQLEPRVQNAADVTRSHDRTAYPPQRARSLWRPLTATTSLDPADLFDSRIMRILHGEEELPDWWPRDDSGYAITKHDLDYLGINPVQVKWMLTGEAPLGMSPALYQRFGTEVLEALERDGFEPSQVDVRLKGSSAGLFSGIHKTLPREEDLSGNPTAARRLREWFGDRRNRPLRCPHDAMWRLGLEPVPSDFDLDFNSTAVVRTARAYWRAHHADRYRGDFMAGHGYLDRQAVMGSVPTLDGWARRWEKILGRPISLGVFESSGPFNETVLGRSLSSHRRDTDWIIHTPDSPWPTPRSKIPDLDRIGSPGNAPRSGIAPWQPGDPRDAPAAAQPASDVLDPQASRSADPPRPASRPPQETEGPGLGGLSL